MNSFTGRKWPGIFRLSVLLVATSVMLGGCIGAGTRDLARKVAKGGMLRSDVIATDHFDIYAYTRFSRHKGQLTVYIEGDGNAWVNRHTLSRDPTPRNPTALRMAAADASANVAYLGRPCQYVEKSRRRNCKTDYWSKKRFAEEVVASTDQAIDQLKERVGASAISLIGYSGGGAVAALVAARRNDVVALRTVAGNLDHVAFTDQHRVTPLSGSLNPIEVAEKIKKIPQMHFVGAKDRSIPPFIAEKFIKAQGKGACARSKTVSGMEHHSEWEKIWPRLLRHSLPTCN